MADIEQDEASLVVDTSSFDPGSEGEVSQDPNDIPVHCDDVAGPEGSDVA